MKAVLSAYAKAFGQLADAAVLRVLAKTVALTLLVFAVLGIALYAGLDWIVGTYEVEDGALAAAAAAVVLTGLAAWFLFRIVALAVLQFFADEIVAAVEARHYPVKARQAVPLPFRQDLANSLRGAARALGVNLLALPVALVLLITGIGPALVFLAVNAWLLGRELTDMAWLRHSGGLSGGDPSAENPVPKSERFLLGGITAAIMVVPVVNLLAPILGAAAGTHLAHRWIARKGDETLG